MHIAIDARALTSSTGTVLRKLLPRLEERDRENRYTLILRRGDEKHWRSDAADFTTATVDAEPWSLASQTRLLTLLWRLKPDLVWFFMPEQPVLYRGCTLTTFFDLTMIKAPPASVRRRWRSYVKMPLGKLVFRMAARSSDRIMVSARATQEEVAARYGIPEDRFAVVHCGAEVEPGKVEPYPNGYDRFLLYVGQHGWHKDLLRLCDAHQRLLERHPDLGLIFVGKVDRQAEVTREHIVRNGYRKIEFTGFLPDPQRDWLYRNAAAYVFPSLLEGFGLPGLEAMGFGTPVISSDATCLPEIYGDAARYFRAGDTEDLVRAIEDVLRDPALRAQLAQRGLEQYTRYSYDRMADEMVKLFSTVLRECKTQASR